MSSNGETTVNHEDLSIDDKLNLIIEAQIELSEKLDELNERLSNLSLPGVDFEVTDYDS